MSDNHLYACIMAGGTGSRFWPESTVNRPKQLLSIGTDQTLLNLTLERITHLVPHQRQFIVTGDAIVEQVQAHTPTIPPANVISEPLRKNTAPCILLAAKIIAQRDPEAVICVLPSDHLIRKPDRFLKILEAAVSLASQQDVLITLGIQARYPETGYGYIEFGENSGQSKDLDYFKVKAFHEKPDEKRAQRYIESGNFYWNSGMFVWSAKSIIHAIKTHLPALYAAMEKLDGVTDPTAIKKLVDEIYPELDAISIDFGVMEKADNIYGFPADIDWNDVGSWSCLEELLDPDEKGNVSQGRFVSIDSKGCIVSAQTGLAVAIGVKDLIIVQTPNAVLVCDKSRAQQIKEIFGILEENDLEEFL